MKLGIPLKIIRNKFKIGAALLFLFCFSSAFFAFASSTDGVIDSTHKYAWGENIGWINFGASNGNIHITDSALTGKVWTQNYGWINLNPSTSGVKNNGEGTLSGYAWGENLGWIDFSNVKISSGGVFSGYASSTISGKINFDCLNCEVITDWRPVSSRQTSSGTSGGGGGGLPSEAYSLPTPPAGGFSVAINSNQPETNSSAVLLNIKGGSDTDKIAISNSSDFIGSSLIPYASEIGWILSGDYGQKTVYIKFYNKWGQSSEIFSDSIIYQQKSQIVSQTTQNIPTSQSENNQSFFQQIIGKIIGLLVPKKEIPKTEVITVPKMAPMVFGGNIELLPKKLISSFVLSPLPQEIKSLALKFPSLGNTFKAIGVNKITDVEKLSTAKLFLPGLGQVTRLPNKLEPGKLALPTRTPVADLSAGMKDKLPSGVVFVRSAQGLIDLSVALSLDDQGQPQQKITTISGQSLELVIKVNKPAKSVKGYIIFKSKNVTPNTSSNNGSVALNNNQEMTVNNLMASALFSAPSFSQDAANANLVALEGVGTYLPESISGLDSDADSARSEKNIETRLVTMEFEYTDENNDGIYTARIPAPLVEGEYEIVTSIDYYDSQIASKEIKMITVVDPEGYVYEKQGDKETRIPGAVISLYWLNPDTKQYELWPAKNFQQENPQVTDVRGTYSFLVPEGFYYLKVDAPGYLSYDGESFEVKEGSGIHVNIELKTKYWWTKIVDWQTVVMILVVLLLLYNFYKDKIRDRAAYKLSNKT